MLEGEDLSELGIQIVDNGDYIRAIGPNNVPQFDIIPYKDTDQNDTGIRYAIGTDITTGKTKVRYVDYPVPPFNIESVRSNPNVPQIFEWCRICDSVDAIKASRGGQLVPQNNAPRQHQQIQSQVLYTEAEMVPMRPKRVGLANTSMLPKYVPFLADFAKSLFLNRFGETVASIAISVGADFIGSMSDDPDYQDAWRQLSDQQIDGVASKIMTDNAYLDDVKRESKMLIDAYKDDGNLFNSILSSVTQDVNQIDASRSFGGGKNRGKSSPKSQFRFRSTID